MSAVTSDISGVPIGEGKDKKEIYTATKVTPTTDENGKTIYKMEVIQYDDANGGGGRTIGEKDGSKINWNDNANKDITGNANAIKSINNASKNQAKWKAADEWCKDRKIEFKIITEKELGIK